MVCSPAIVIVLMLVAFVAGAITSATVRGASDETSWVPAALSGLADSQASLRGGGSQDPATNASFGGFPARASPVAPSVSASPSPVAQADPEPAAPSASASPSAPAPPAGKPGSSPPHPAVIAPPLKVDGSTVDASYQPTDEELAGTAIVTMAAGDEAGALAVALMQSLRDVGTRVPRLIVMLMQRGQGSRDCKSDQERLNKGCSQSSEPSDIVSQPFLDALHALDVETPVLPALPLTKHTEQIAGGAQSGWGMAFNKLRVFGMVEHRRLLWLDADTLILRNVDHLLVAPEFTAAFTNDCNNGNAAYKISGGMWVVEPSAERMAVIDEVRETGRLGEGQEWRLGDMEIVLFMFAKFTRASREDGFWPSSYDLRQGRVPGVELFDRNYAAGGPHAAKPAGPLPEAVEAARAEGKTWWLPLDVRYDYLVHECMHLRQRDLGLPQDAAAEIGLAPAQAGRPWGSGDDVAAPGFPFASERTKVGYAWEPKTSPTGYADGFISLHYSCLQPPLMKPPRFASEQALVDNIGKTEPCIRQYMALWYSKYLRAMKGERWLGETLSEPAKNPPPLA